MGMTHGTIASMLLSDLICGRENPWTDLYDPARMRLSAAGEFTRENANVVGQYTRWIKPGEVESVEEIPLGQGAIMSQGARILGSLRGTEGFPVEAHPFCPNDAHNRALLGKRRKT